mgnify:CR=1 FL=1
MAKPRLIVGDFRGRKEKEARASIVDTLFAYTLYSQLTLPG